MPHRSLMIPLALSTMLAGCLPAQLDKYRRHDRLKTSAELGVATSRDVTPEAAVEIPPAPPPRASIYALDRQTYRVAVREGDVWDGVLTVLLHNYNLTIVDRASGIVSTEWDSYFLGGAVYRNKLSLRVLRIGPNACDLMIHNNVERLRDAGQAAGSVGAVWLPTPDPASEVPRIMQNLAAVLHQPPPILPPDSAIATKLPAESSPVAR